VVAEADGALDTMKLTNDAQARISECLYAASACGARDCARAQARVLLLDEPAAAGLRTRSHIILDAMRRLPATA